MKGSLLRIALGVAVLCALIWHLLPLVVWHLSLGPELRAMPSGARLQIETLRDFPAAPASWDAIVVGNLSLAIPPGANAQETCRSAAANCFLELEAGTVNVFGADYLESYAELVNLRAPDERDLSWTHSANTNWRTIRALRTRVETSRSKLDSFRFERDGVKGIVAATRRGETERWIVAAYSTDEHTSRGIGIAGRSEEDLLRILGSLELRAAE